MIYMIARICAKAAAIPVRSVLQKLRRNDVMWKNMLERTSFQSVAHKMSVFFSESAMCNLDPTSLVRSR